MQECRTTEMRGHCFMHLCIVAFLHSYWAWSVPRSQRFPDGDQLSDVVSVVIGNDEDRSEPGLVRLAGRHWREGVERRLRDERLQCLSIEPEQRDRFVPRGVVGRLRRGRPVIVGPCAIVDVVGIRAEVQQIALRDAHVLDQLPWGVLEARRRRTTQVMWKAFDRLVEGDVGIFPVEQTIELGAQRLVHDGAYYARCAEVFGPSPGRTIGGAFPGK